MDDKKLIERLRNEFAPRIREMCADDYFDCDELCAGNILTAKCIVLQAADRIEALTAQLAASEREKAEAVADLTISANEPFHCGICKKENLPCSMSADGTCEFEWRGPQEAGEVAQPPTPAWAAQFERRFIRREEATHGKD